MWEDVAPNARQYVDTRPDDFIRFLFGMILLGCAPTVSVVETRLFLKQTMSGGWCGTHDND